MDIELWQLQKLYISGLKGENLLEEGSKQTCHEVSFAQKAHCFHLSWILIWDDLGVMQIIKGLHAPGHSLKQSLLQDVVCTGKEEKKDHFCSCFSEFSNSMYYV